MSFYTNMKIRNKLILGFGLLVCTAFIIGLFGYAQINLIQKADNIMYAKGAVPVEHIGDIAANFQRVRTNIRELILSKDEKSLHYYKDRIGKFRQEIDLMLKSMKGSLPDNEAKNLSLILEEKRTAYTPHIEKIIALCLSDKKSEAIFYINSSEVNVAEQAEVIAIENLQHYLMANSKKISESNRSTADASAFIILFMAGVASLLAAIMAFFITQSIVKPLKLSLEVIKQQENIANERAKIITAIASGNLEEQLTIYPPLNMKDAPNSHDEAGKILTSMIKMSEVQYFLDMTFADMTLFLKNNRDADKNRDKLKNGMNELNRILSGDKTTAMMAEKSISFLADFLKAGSAVLYLADEDGKLLHIAASYAFIRRKRIHAQIRLGEGLAGQAALERNMICLERAPADYMTIGSGVGEAEPANILAIPIIYENDLIGVLEFSTFTKFSDNDFIFLNQSIEALGIAFSVNRSRQKVNELLTQTQKQAEELRVQQEELQQTNEELEERAQMLELQKEQIRAKNREVEAASHELELKAEELQRISSYKSEFLANMSHELRTPLNSMMILSSLLKDNREGTLTQKQVEFAATINGAGRDLLNLINDILDLSKIEAGKMDFNYEELALSQICEQIQGIFAPIAMDKGIDFEVILDSKIPETISADGQRVQQILKNLLSNASKFTSQGSFKLKVYTPEISESPLNTPSIAFAVTDTGIGIQQDKQSLIFNAFQQADGSTSRNYGGTGLGLSISRQLARTMGGDIILISEKGKGSTFTLYLPIKQGAKIESEFKKGVVAKPTKSAPPTILPTPTTTQPAQNQTFDAPLPSPIPDDRESLTIGDKSILIIEDDLTFANVLLDMVRERGFAALVAIDGESGIALAERYQPSAVILDVMLPHIDGWGVMRSLKDNPKTRHIPVHFITCLEERQKAMSMGAVGFVTKPVNSEQLDSVFGTLESAIEKTMKMLLIVEDDKVQAAAMVALLETRNVTITVAETGTKAIELFTVEPFDCIVLDLGLADMGAFELLEELKRLDPERRVPVIIHTGRELTKEEDKKLRHYAESIIIKGAKSPERLLNEVTLFLHLVETSLDPGKQKMIRAALDKEAMLEGKKVLIVDDDMRNIFSLSSALSEKNMIIMEAENGHEALRTLDQQPDIDLVLMDIMMPEMDGYEAMRSIRKDPRFHNLPIIALTAKAMKGDREECLKAGANDYIPKPVDIDKLFSLLRVWLYNAG